MTIYFPKIWFTGPQELIENKHLDEAIDRFRQHHGFSSIVHASSCMDGATAISRSHLGGGHAGGMDGLD